MAGELADGLVARVPMCDRRALACPVDERCRSHMSFATSRCESRKAEQQVLRIAHRESGRATQGEIGFDSVHHECTSGHGWAMLRSSAISTLA